MHKFGILIGLLCGFTCVADELDHWLQNQERASIQKLFANISPEGAARGAVAASPSKQNPDYYYHWVRDAALVMNAVVDLYVRVQSPAEKDFYQSALLEFIEFSRSNQMTPNPSGHVGEPKFHMDGSAFFGPWGRPQNDGPALRVVTLARLADIWFAEGKAEWVARWLYRPELPAHTVIKADLEFLSHHWREKCFDLWEEVRGYHFYTRMAQRKALLLGSALAARLGDSGASGWYALQAEEIAHEIHKHWKDRRGVIVPTLGRDAGVDYKFSDLDSAVILGVLHAETQDGFYGVEHDGVIQTVMRQEDAFRKLYPINNKDHRGIGIGRYPEDKYNGYVSEGQGNPWFINTHAFGEYYYRLANHFRERGHVEMTDSRRELFSRLGINISRTASRVTLGTPVFSALISGLVRKGDDFLWRSRLHSAGNGNFSEQIHRQTGFMQGAENLTWSHSSYLTAYWNRH